MADLKAQIAANETGRQALLKVVDTFGLDVVQAYMPVATLHDLIIEIRALSHGMGFFTREFDHLAELSGREAETAIAERQAAHG